MILDITFDDKAPSQYQGVKMTTFYNRPHSHAPEEIIIHFYEYARESVYLPLKNIRRVQVTND